MALVLTDSITSPATVRQDLQDIAVMSTSMTALLIPAKTMLHVSMVSIIELVTALLSFMATTAAKSEMHVILIPVTTTRTALSPGTRTTVAVC